MNLRMTGLAAVVVFTALLPLAGASAEPEVESAPAPEPTPVPADAKAAAAPVPDASARCGPELRSPEGVEAQTCVLTGGGRTWARTYYRNATGAELRSVVLALMGPAGRTVQMYCAVGAEDEPGVCETPRERSRGKAGEYVAVSEFAAAADGPLLLRSGSNSAAPAPR
ncbi:hypothetical protein GCM10010353_57940 [Streptomyces chryseus]|nr:hypothetical protein GCM10010353_57940 [Streptomyces chryseus]